MAGPHVEPVTSQTRAEREGLHSSLQAPLKWFKDFPQALQAHRSTMSLLVAHCISNLQLSFGDMQINGIEIIALLYSYDLSCWFLFVFFIYYIYTFLLPGFLTLIKHNFM